MHAVTKSFFCFLALFAALVAALPVPESRLHRRTCATDVHVHNANAPLTSSHVVPTHTTHSPLSAAATSVPADTHAPASNGLFPVGHSVQSWSTSPATQNPLPLTDSTFRPTNMISALAPNYVSAPDGRQSMRAHYPQGSFTFTHQPQGGLSFYAPGPSQVDLTTAKEATFGYTVLFQQGFAFNIGGKLPGLYGGDSESEAIGCSGGRRSSACFSARLMWREQGAGELYTYLPPTFSANQAVCNVAPSSTCNPTYGASVGRGAFSFTPGQRATVSQRVRLNDVGQTNGEIEVFMNGRSVINVGGLVLRDSAAGRIRGIQMQTFFGGHTAMYASPKTQDAFFSDFSVAITEKL